MGQKVFSDGNTVLKHVHTIIFFLFKGTFEEPSNFIFSAHKEEN